jgi:hypothetical protein
MRVCFLCLSLVAAGCAKDKTDVSPRAKGELAPIPSPHPALASLPDPALQGGKVGRAARRLTTAQLRESIKVTTGQAWAGLDTFASSLGEADFALTTAEATEPNLVFAKFLDAGAREVCAKAASEDQLKADPAQRVLSRELPGALGPLTALTRAQLDANLVYLSTRFWGQPLSGAELERWAAFFSKAAATVEAAPSASPGPSREQVFAMTCVALMTDPRFFTY